MMIMESHRQQVIEQNVSNKAANKLSLNLLKNYTNVQHILAFSWQMGPASSHMELRRPNVGDALDIRRGRHERPAVRCRRPRRQRLPPIRGGVRSAHQQMDAARANEQATRRRRRWRGQRVFVRAGRPRLSGQQSVRVAHGNGGALRSGYRYVDVGECE